VKNKPVEAAGTIKFKGPQTRWQLAVAFFLPIYLDYNILDIDENYQYALVSGSSQGHLWLLPRESNMPEEMKQRFLQRPSPWVSISASWNGWIIRTPVEALTEKMTPPLQIFQRENANFSGIRRWHRACQVCYSLINY
jgi:hypothetical protein